MFNEKARQLHPNSVATALVYWNEPRWGGSYDELVSTLQHIEALEQYVSTAIRYNLHGEQDKLPTALKLVDLHPEDWTIFAEFEQFLQPLRKWQLMLQGHQIQGAKFDVLLEMKEFILHIEDQKSVYNAFLSKKVTNHMVTAINNAWTLLDMYYNTILKTLVYYSAIALNPKMKLRWFLNIWQNRPTWIIAAESAVNHHHWVSEIRAQVPLVRPPVSSTTTSGITVTEALSNLRNWKSK